MKTFSEILLLISFAIIVKITMARYLLVKIDQEQALPKVEGEWLYFQSLERDFYMGDPRLYVAMDAVYWDRANRNDTFPGKHMIEGMNGDNLKLKDLRSGMKVKVKTYKPHFNGYKYLYTTEIGNVYYDKRREGDTDANNKQKWFIHFNEFKTAIVFESAYWRGEYLNGKVPCHKFGCWLDVDEEKYTWWKIIVPDSE